MPDWVRIILIFFVIITLMKNPQILTHIMNSLTIFLQNVNSGH